jgi:hypothetical protein
MHFPTIAILLGLAVSSIAAPVADLNKRALKSQTFNQFTVSAGVAGNALAEVNAKFPVGALSPPPRSFKTLTIPG